MSSPAKIVVELAKTLFEVSASSDFASYLLTRVKSLKGQRECHKLAVSLAEELHAKLPIADIIPERMQNEYIRSSLCGLLEVVREAFVFLHKYAKTSASRTSDITTTLSFLMRGAEQLLSSQKETITELYNKLSRASHNFHLSLSSRHYVESSEYRIKKRKKVVLIFF